MPWTMDLCPHQVYHIHTLNIMRMRTRTMARTIRKRKTTGVLNSSIRQSSSSFLWSWPWSYSSSSRHSKNGGMNSEKNITSTETREIFVKMKGIKPRDERKEEDSDVERW
ncbi:hypothetical protein Q3G72_034762 [Acer saccharum]|nr:hypothetical protein Q3G72_034762 [Acer saccharum]